MRNISKIAIISLLSVAMIWSCTKKKEDWKPNPPFKGLEIATNIISINPNVDTVLTFASGTSITIPAGSIVKTDGTPVTGKYDLLYREFHDAMDIFLSGIPMSYDSLGQKYTFQTAGMFEIDARAGEEKLRIADDKTIDVKLGSKYRGDNYSFYNLNPETGSWEWMNLPKAEVNKEKVDAQAAIQTKKPQLFMGDEYFALSYMAFLDIYLGNDRDKIYQQRDSKVIKAKLEAYKFKMYGLPAVGELKFGKGYYHPIEMLWKDTDGKKFPTWTKDFFLEWGKNAKNEWDYVNCFFRSLGNNKYEVTYMKEKKVFKKTMEAIIPLKNLLRLPANEWEKRYDDAMAELAAEQAKIDVMAETFRAFSLNKLGTYNYDALMKMDNWFPIAPTFTLSEVPKTTNDVIIIFGDNSGYIQLKANELAEFMRINPESGHRILMLLPNNEIGVYPVSALKELDVETLRSQQKPQVAFNLESYKVEDAVALREFLGFK
jgi:hypothetical protein